MKVHPPKPDIDPDDPFKDTLFDRKTFADSLTAILRNTTDSLVIIVHAPWGDGKTTFAEMWRAELTRLKLHAVYFDAYSADYFQDPFVCFSGEILKFADEHFSDHKISAARGEFKKRAIEVGKRFAGLAAKVAIKSATLGAVGETHIKEAKEITEFATSLGEIGASAIEKKIEDYTSEKDSLAAFKKSLRGLAATVRQTQGFPLVVIVDELDRCRPDFALSLLERVKHLFDVENVAFILLVNRDQIESYIRRIYGDVDARSYLLKFANLFVELPNRTGLQIHHTKGRRDYCEKLFTYHELPSLVQGEGLRDFVGVLAEHFDITLRETEKVFGFLSLYYSSVPRTEFTCDYLVGALALFKVARPQLYNRLRTQAISFQEFLSETKLNRINGQAARPNVSWANKAVFSCVMTDTEFQEAVRTDKEQGGFRRRYSDIEEWMGHIRPKAIPIHCARLDQFAFRP